MRFKSLIKDQLETARQLLLTIENGMSTNVISAEDVYQKVKLAKRKIDEAMSKVELENEG